MPRWSLVVLGIAILVLVAESFRLLPAPYFRGADWAVAGALGVGAVVAGRRNLAIWCGIFAGLLVLHQPIFPIDAGRYAMTVALATAATTAVCVIRHW